MDRLRSKFRGAKGGRVGYNQGNLVMASAPDPMAERWDTLENMALEQYGKRLNQLSPKEIKILEMSLDEMNMNDFYNKGGRVGRMGGGMMIMGDNGVVNNGIGGILSKYKKIRSEL